MTLLLDRPAGVDAAPADLPVAAPRPRPPYRRVALLGCVVALVLDAVVHVQPLPAAGLTADTGIQFHLAWLTAHDALPVRDFAHGWNALSWYLHAGLYELSGGRPTLWAFLWVTVTGRLLGGLLALVIAWRAGLSTAWLVGVTGATLVISHLPNGKYALPLLWLAVLVPRGWTERPVSALVVRALLAGTLLLTHLELAVMLCAGTALYDLLGARGVRPAVRAARVLALGTGALLAFAVELAAYASAGVPPDELVRFLVVERARVSEAATAFGYPLLDPPSLMGAVLPAALLLPFAPAVWRRLSDPTRLTAALNLSLGLVALRSPGEMHIAASGGLLAVLGVLAAHDLVGARADRPARRVLLLPAAAVGAAWLLGGVLLAVRTSSVVALAVLVAAGALGACLAHVRRLTWTGFSAGAVAAALALSGTAVAGPTAAQLAGPADEAWDRQVAGAVAADVDRCLGADRRAFVVPEPLGLYRLLDLENPTPYFLFWDGLADELPDLRARMAAGTLPAFVQVGPWVRPLLPLVPEVEAAYDLCAAVVVPDVRRPGSPEIEVRVWVRRA